MSLNQNLNKFSKIKQWAYYVGGGRTWATASLCLEFLFLFYITFCLHIFRIYFTFRFAFSFFSHSEFISGPRLFGILHLCPSTRTAPWPRLIIKLGPALAKTKCKKKRKEHEETPLSQPKVVKRKVAE